MIFDGIVRSTGEHFRNFCPPISKPEMTFNDESVFLRRPSLRLVDAGIQMIMPALTTLFSTSAGKMRRNGTPLFGSFRECNAI
jgi:hypothetical protein